MCSRSALTWQRSLRGLTQGPGVRKLRSARQRALSPCLSCTEYSSRRLSTLITDGRASNAILALTRAEKQAMIQNSRILCAQTTRNLSDAHKVMRTWHDSLGIQSGGSGDADKAVNGFERAEARELLVGTKLDMSNQILSAHAKPMSISAAWLTTGKEIIGEQEIEELANPEFLSNPNSSVGSEIIREKVSMTKDDLELLKKAKLEEKFWLHMYSNSDPSDNTVYPGDFKDHDEMGDNSQFDADDYFTKD